MSQNVYTTFYCMQKCERALVSNDNMKLFNITSVDFCVALLRLTKLSSIPMCQNRNGNLSGGSPKIKTFPPVGKVITTILWDPKGILQSVGTTTVNIFEIR